jgi:hypothetical protein
VAIRQSSHNDLFMATKKVEKWILVFYNHFGIMQVCRMLFDHKAEAEEYLKKMIKDATGSMPVYPNATVLCRLCSIQKIELEE